MSDERCETCRHWKTPVDDFIFAPVGVCLVARAGRDVFDECDGYNSVPADSCALDYPVCDLITGPRFGCAKWETNNTAG